MPLTLRLPSPNDRWVLPPENILYKIRPFDGDPKLDDASYIYWMAFIYALAISSLSACIFLVAYLLGYVLVSPLQLIQISSSSPFLSMLESYTSFVPNMLFPLIPFFLLIFLCNVNLRSVNYFEGIDPRYKQRPIFLFIMFLTISFFVLPYAAYNAHAIYFFFFGSFAPQGSTLAAVLMLLFISYINGIVVVGCLKGLIALCSLIIKRGAK